MTPAIPIPFIADRSDDAGAMCAVAVIIHRIADGNTSPLTSRWLPVHQSAVIPVNVVDRAQIGVEIPRDVIGASPYILPKVRVAIVHAAVEDGYDNIGTSL